MILLITSSPGAKDCANAIAEAISQPVKIAATPRQASILLSADEFEVLILDQQTEESDPGDIESALLQMGTATPVFVNLAISGTGRVIRELRVAMRRRDKENLIAHEGAQQKLRNELKDTVTALLLSCEMALHAEALPPSAQARIRTVENLARDLGRKLGFAA